MTRRICKRLQRPRTRSADQLRYSLSAWHASDVASKGRRSLPLRTPRGNHQPAADATDFACGICAADTRPSFHRTNLLLWYLWHVLVWTATTNPSQALASLRALKSRGESLMGSTPERWAGVRGPFGAMVLSLKRIGWSLASPLEFTARDGQTYPLTSFSPAFLQLKMKADWDCMLRVRRHQAWIPRRDRWPQDPHGYPGQ